MMNFDTSDNRPTTSFETLPTGAPVPPSDSQEAHELVKTIVEAAEDRKGAEITVLRVSEVSYLADYIVIVTGFSTTQVRAIARSIEAKVEEVWQRQPRKNEGINEGKWILQDYGDVIVHVFMPQEREFYSLEAFWGHADRLTLPNLELAQEA
jgi:ribosome-associated protein